jgi:hypothetical protein
MATFQIRYLIDWLLIITNFAFESLLITFEELPVDLLHSPLLVIFFSIYFIQFLLFMLVERVLPLDYLPDFVIVPRLKGLKVLLMSAVPLIACEAIVVFRGDILRCAVDIKAVSKSFRRNMFVHFQPLFP